MNVLKPATIVTNLRLVQLIQFDGEKIKIEEILLIWFLSTLQTHTNIKCISLESDLFGNELSVRDQTMSVRNSFFGLRQSQPINVVLWFHILMLCKRIYCLTFNKIDALWTKLSNFKLVIACRVFVNVIPAKVLSIICNTRILFYLFWTFKY